MNEETTPATPEEQARACLNKIERACRAGREALAAGDKTAVRNVGVEIDGEAEALILMWPPEA